MAEYPYTIARSTGTATGSDNTGALLASILAAGTLDEISNAEDFSAIERYIRNQGRVRRVGSKSRSKNTLPVEENENEKTTTGLLFWVYPTGLHGPFHRVGEGGGGGEGEGGGGEIEVHGLLVAVERGVVVSDAMRKVREEFRNQGIGHLHIAKNDCMLSAPG